MSVDAAAQRCYQQPVEAGVLSGAWASCSAAILSVYKLFLLET